jgi:hypothetical protein
MRQRGITMCLAKGGAVPAGVTGAIARPASAWCRP